MVLLRVKTTLRVVFFLWEITRTSICVGAISESIFLNNQVTYVRLFLI